MLRRATPSPQPSSFGSQLTEVENLGDVIRMIGGASREESVSAGSTGGQPTFTDFMEFRRETRELVDRGQREAREVAREDRHELLAAVEVSRSESEAARLELLNAIAAVVDENRSTRQEILDTLNSTRSELKADLRESRAELSADITRVENRVEALAEKTDKNDRELYAMQRVISALVAAAVLVATILGGIAAFQ